MKRWLPIGIIIAIIIIGGAAYTGSYRADAAPGPPPTPVAVPVTRGDVRQTVTAPGLLVNTQEALLGFEVSGRIAKIAVRPGQELHAGEVIATLETKPFVDALTEAKLDHDQAETERARDLAQARLDLTIAEAELAQEKAKRPQLVAAEAALTAAETELAEMEAAPDPDAITIAAAALRQAESDLKQAQGNYNRVAYRGDIAMLPEAAALEEATLIYEQQRATYNLAVQKASPAELAAARATVQRARADVEQILVDQSTQNQQLTILAARIEQTRLTITALSEGIDPALVQAVKRAEENLAAATIVAPFDGVVLEIQAKPGETILDGAGVVLLADVNALEVAAEVIEEDLPLVRVGQSADIFFDAVPDEAVPGRVARIVPQRLSHKDRPLYAVYLSLDRVPEHLVAGMTADAAIIIAEQRDVLRLPRTLVPAGQNNRAVVEVWENQAISRREILVGLRGDVYREIISGLDEGMAVIGQ
ncbi:MAG: efflux RND transporter periplasmic adaptor subunit [Anaerolineae bacterium]|nr:efflux RND transporter periplasmic adaptor subunit [Anaerolineae bacterium]